MEWSSEMWGAYVFVVFVVDVVRLGVGPRDKQQYFPAPPTLYCCTVSATGSVDDTLSTKVGKLS
jgi:hypothetical protein